MQTTPSKFVEVPSQGVSSADLDIERELTLTGEALEVSEVVRVKGLLAVTLRDDLAGPTMRERLGSWLGARATVHTAKVEHLDDPSKPLTIVVTYLANNQVQRSGQELVVTPPSSWEQQALAVRRLDKRTLPFEVRYRTAVSAVNRLQLGPGQSVRPTERLGANDDALVWTLEPMSGKPAVGRTFVLERKVTHGPAAAYQAWWNANEKALASLEQPFVISVASSKP